MAESRPESKEDVKIDTQDWEETKKQGPVLLKVVLTNKTEDKDLKVWYRLTAGPQGEEGLNVQLPQSRRKTYLSTNCSRVMELLLKVDPSKPYFCKNIEDITIELESTVRNTGGSTQERG